MKKVISVVLSIISVVCITFTFVGCGERPNEETTDTDGRLCTITNAFNEEYLDGDDLKSIACGYYEWQNIEENPYSGLYEAPAKPLSKETEKKIIRAYFGQSEGLKILKYYGTYEGNVVVTLGYEDIDYDGVEKVDLTIGGVNFYELKHSIHVYHYFEKADPSIEITGRLFRIDQAYKNGWIGEDGLKSIACCVNDSDSSMENPYSGMYEPPAQKLSKNTKNELKQAYIMWVDDSIGELDDIKIHNYYGTYNGRMVVSMTDNGCSYGATTEGTEIGGVTFNNSEWRSIYVYYQYK
ncbi:MAG: hypothetical protein K2M47_04660 [Clostridiales bacterium]|nr:hypothetical protein [Clostridiales bacterium]